MIRDRTGDEIDPDADPFDHTCDRGWIDYANRRPCARCRPWLVSVPTRPPTKTELARLVERHPTRPRHPMRPGEQR